MKIIFKITIFLQVAALLLLCSCQSLSNIKPMGMYRGMEDGAPKGTPVFRSGWKSGCESGMAAMGSLQYKLVHGFDYNPEMLNNNEYHNAWRLGFRYCRWYTTQIVRPEE